MRVTPEDSLAPEMEVETTDGLISLVRVKCLDGGA